MKKKSMRGAAALLALALLGSAWMLPAAAESADEPAATVQSAGEHTITFVVNGNVVGTATYDDTTAKEDIELPVYTAGRTYQTFGVGFYRYKWDNFELTGEDITVKGHFSIIHYTVNFYVEDVETPVVTSNLCIEDQDYTVPEIPAKEGYDATWQVRSVDTVNDVVTIVAKYIPQSRDPMHSGHYLALLRGRSVCRELDPADFENVDGVVRMINDNGCIELLSGVIQSGSDFYYYENGLPAYKGVVRLGDDFYFFRSNGKMVRGQSYELGRMDQTHGLVPFGVYEFDENGRMLNVEFKDGFTIDDDGEIRYYVNNVAVYAGVVEHDGDYYYFNSTLKAVRNSSGYFIWPVTTNGLIPSGLYKMDANGVMDIEDYIPLRVDEYVEGTKGVVSNGEGGFFYIDANDEIVTNCVFIIYEEATNGLIESGVYLIDPNGSIVERMGDVPPTEKLEGAEAQVSIAIVRAKAMLNKVGVVGVVTDGNGNYYFVNASKRVVKKSIIRVADSNSNGLLTNGIYNTATNGVIDLSSKK